MYTKRHKGASARIAKRQKVKKYVTTIFKSALGLFLLVGTILLARADFLQINDFEIVGAKNISPDGIKNVASSFASGYRFGLLPKSNILIFNKDLLAEKMLEEFTRLGKVEVDKKLFGRRVEVRVEERGAKYLWCSPTEECFFMSDDGLLFEKVSEEKAFEAAGKVVFRGVLSNDPLLQYFASLERMKNYTDFMETLAKNNINITSIDVPLPDKAVAETEIGQIIFNPEEADLGSVAFNIILLIEELKTKKPAAQFEYIDARFGNKVFYKAI